MEFRKASEEDLHLIVRLLADDELGSQRERFEEPLPAAYYEAFNDIESQVDWMSSTDNNSWVSKTRDEASAN